MAELSRGDKLPVTLLFYARRTNTLPPRPLKLRLKDAVKRLFFTRPLRGFGFVAVPRRVLDRYPAADFLKRLFTLLDIDCVLDVGANTGQYRDFLRDEVGYSGHIISFEPIPGHVELLRARAKADLKWTICGFALGREAGVAEFNIMRETQFSSFREPDHSSTTMFAQSNVVEQRVNVEIKTLEQVLPEIERRLGDLRGIYLKLDTQGFDLEVIGGAGKSLGRIKALQAEVSVKPIYTGTVGYEHTISELRGKHFELSAIFPNNPAHFPSLIEFDCYMVSTRALDETRISASADVRNS